MADQHARRLTRHYALLLGAVAVPLLVLVMALAVQQFAGERRAILDELAGKAHAERIALEPVIQAASNHVRGLRELAEDRLAGRLPQPEMPLRQQLAPVRHANSIEGIFLDQLAAAASGRFGNVLGDLTLLQRSPAEMGELDLALDLFTPMRLAHLGAPQLRWSYYLSARGDFMTMYPFVPSSEFVALGDYHDMHELIARWLGYDVFVDGTPAHDPDRRPYWTGVYSDAGGAGLMVSHAAPTYADGQFMGVVGTDILLSYLSDFLQRIDWPVGTVWIVDNSGKVLATRFGTRAFPAVTSAERLPQPLADLPLAQVLEAERTFRHLAGNWVVSERLGESPFSLLYAVPDHALMGLILPRFKPYALILATLMLALLAAHYLLQHRFVRPALLLVRHIQNESQGGEGVRGVPSLWRPWFDAVSAAFAGARTYQARLAESEARLKAAAESIPDGLAIFDSEDRLAFYNSHYPEHLVDGLRATMALGKRWSDWGREAATLGPLYHPEMGEAYLERRIEDRSLAALDREHRLADGRWVRVRESRMRDGGRVLLTTDTTVERRERQERALIATAMAQVGDSIEIADTDYRLLYVNPAFTELTGYTVAEALGRTPGELLRSDQHDSAFFAAIDRVVRSGEVWKGRIVSRHKDSHLIHQDATISPVYGENGEFLYFVAAKRDIGDKIRAEAALEESRRTHAAALEAALDCFISADEQGRIIEFNPAAERTFGYTVAEVRGQPLHELLIPPALRAAHIAGIRRYLTTGVSRILGRRLELSAVRKDGVEIPVELVVVATRHEDRPTFMAYMRDLSEQKRTEAALRASEAHFQAAAASIPDSLVILDPEDRIVFYNSRHPELVPPALREGLALGIRFEDWIRDGLARGPIYHPDMGSDYADRRLASRADGPTEREHKHIDGRWVRIREAPMPDGGRVILMTDITDRREAEARFLAAAESIPDGLAILDAEDRLVFYNSRYPGHLTDNLRKVLRLGIRFEDLIGEALALGPIYHADMGEDFAAHRLALRAEQHSEHEYKVVDGRWVRIRESRMADGGRVLLTSDITEQRRHRQQLSLLAMAVDQVGDAVEITNAQGHFTYVNPAFVRLTGFAPAEVMGRLPQDVLTSGRHDGQYFATMERCLREGSSWQGLIVNRRKDGALVYQDTTISPLRDAHGRITHFVAVKRDVTEQEKSEAALRASEARYRALVETQTEFVLRQLPDGRLTFVNEAYCRYVSKPREEMLRASWNDLETIAPEHRMAYEQHMRRLTPARPTAAMEIRAILPNGSERWERWVDTGVFDGDGKLIELQSTGRDITEQKNSELALRESEARYRAVVEGQTEFILRLDPEGNLTFVNDAYCRYRGLSRETMLGGFNDVAHYPPEQQKRIRGAWAGLTPEAPSVTYELEKPTASGVRWEEWTDTAIFARHGHRIEYQAIGRDITERKQSEQFLRESEARYRALVETQTEFIIRHTPEGRLTFVNEAYCRYLGKAREALLSPSWNDYEAVVAEDRARHDELIDSPTPDHPSAMIELQTVLLDGSQHIEQWSNVGVFDDAGRLLEVQAVGRDVTERRHAERARVESEARFRLIAESVPLPIAITAVDRACALFVNAMGREVFGIEAGTVDQARIQSIWVDLASRSEVARRIASEGSVDQVEVRMRRRDGSEFDAIMSARPLKYGGERAVLGVITDITERRRMEEALRESEARLAALMDNAPLVVHLKDRAGRYLLANPESAKIFRREPAEVIGRTAGEIFPPAETEMIDRHHREVLETGSTHFHEEHQPSLGAYEWSMVIRFPIRDARGKVAVVGCFALDITERKSAEAEIQRQRETLHQSEKLAALGALLAGVAHELNNPLSVVVGYSSMLNELAQDDATRQRAARVHAAAERCARIVKTFLAMARSRPPQHGPVLLSEVVENALELAGYGLRTADIEIIREFPPELQHVWGDSDQLHQVLTNLIVNAQQALLGAALPRRLLVRVRQLAGEIAIDVEDNGPGIPEEVRKRIFEPFFTTKPQGIGTGVGLSVCLGIVTAHGGRIDVRSVPGDTCFSVILPLPAQISAEAEPLAASVSARPARGRVLVVDDEPEIAELVAEHLRLDGLTVEVVASGRKALMRLQAESFDVVVSDLRMPDLDGPALVAALRELHPELARRVVLITGDALGAELNEVMRDAELQVFEKPLDIAALRDQVRRLLEAA